jgi:hypothetical protein
MELARDHYQRQAVVLMMMNPRIPLKRDFIMLFFGDAGGFKVNQSTFGL